MITPVDGPVPSFAEWKAMWEGLAVTFLDPIPAPVTAVADAFRQTYTNGRVLLQQLLLPADQTLWWYLSRNQWKEVQFPSRFWTVPAIRSALPVIWPESTIPDVSLHISFGYTLTGLVASTLAFGGAYSTPPSPGNAWQLADAFRQSLFGDRFDEAIILHAQHAWSPWFYDSAYDLTLIVVDQRTRVATILLATDTD